MTLAGFFASPVIFLVKTGQKIAIRGSSYIRMNRIIPVAVHEPPFFSLNLTITRMLKIAVYQKDRRALCLCRFVPELPYVRDFYLAQSQNDPNCTYWKPHHCLLSDFWEKLTKRAHSDFEEKELTNVRSDVY